MCVFECMANLETSCYENAQALGAGVGVGGRGGGNSHGVKKQEAPLQAERIK